MGKVFLLTGPPASGKSTLRRNLTAMLPSLHAYDYGQLLLKEQATKGIKLRYEDLRQRSSQVVAPGDVTNLDEKLITEVSELRHRSDVLIDSHAVTRESYGFRAVPFSLQQLRLLSLDGVLALRCAPETIVSRITVNSEGRRGVTVELAREHQFLQQAVGMSYGIACGCPVYVLDSEAMDESELAEHARIILMGLGATTPTATL